MGPANISCETRRDGADAQTPLREALRSQGFVHLFASEAGYAADHPHAWAELAKLWNDLPQDQYMRDSGTYRNRRFGRFTLDRETGVLAPNPDAVFVQSAEINRFAGGIARRFAPLQEGFSNHPLFRWLVSWYAGLLPDAGRFWSVDVHVIRITASRGQAGNPTPEGIHRDGQDYVAMTLLARGSNAVGAESGIYDQHKRPLFSHTLREPLEAILVDDRRVLHDASLLAPGGEADSVTRDMLFFNFNAKPDIDDEKRSHDLARPKA